ncbi:MAG: carboxymuconolactone decarboxylase family protein [Bacteroidota bacterium]
MKSETTYILPIVISMAINDKSNARLQVQDALDAGVSYSMLYEAILQIHLFAGYPASIEGLALLKDIYNQEPQSAEPYDVALFKMRGEKLCRDIYTTVFEKMNARMQSFSPELAEWMIIDGYGKTLSRPALDIQTRELINICILSLGKWKQQCISHVRGALNVGISLDDIQRAITYLQSDSTKEAYNFASSILLEFQT